VNPIYLDYAATTPVRLEVREAMLPLLGATFGNPSSVHRWGREAKVRLEEARARIATVIGSSPTEIVFTRGGTEADNLAILGRSRHLPGRSVACSAIEHRAILRTAQVAEAEGSPLHLLPVDSQGVLSPDTLAEPLRSLPAVVSVMWANNEVGTVQPIPELAERCASQGVVFHTDAIQAFGKIPVRVDQVPVGMLSLSAHKVGGPKGVGALFVRKGIRLEALIHGGGHERGLRAGTEDVAGAVGFAVAAELAERDRVAQMERLGGLRDRLQAALRAAVPDLLVNGEGADRLPTMLNVSVPGANSEALLVVLDLEGIAVSSGSACSSGAVSPSHVLSAMGLSPDFSGPSVRFSLGRETTEREIDAVIEIFPPLMQRLRALATA
jgi:cysteine desulfurase